MKIIVGLGNVGKEYINTRHNVGFMLLDKMADGVFQCNKKFEADICNIRIGNDEFILVKPNTYVNRSGISVLKIASFYKIKTTDIFVFYDDLDSSLGKIKYKFSGSNGGHNGIKSIDENIGKNYHRIKIGIGRPVHPSHDISDYVLSRFSEQEMAVVNEKIDRISKNIDEIVKEPIQAVSILNNK